MSGYREIGRVKFWNAEKKFGFIIPDAPSSPDVFFNSENLRAAGIAGMKPGDRVAYTTVFDGRGRLKINSLELFPEQDQDAVVTV